MLQFCLIIWTIEEARIPASPWTNSVVEGASFSVLMLYTLIERVSQPPNNQYRIILQSRRS